jgi:hypothetical protein
VWLQDHPVRNWISQRTILTARLQPEAQAVRCACCRARLHLSPGSQAG